MRALLALAAVIGLVAIGCDGVTGGDDSSPGLYPLIGDTAELVIASVSVPGFTESESEYVDNRAAALTMVDTDKWLADYERLGRVDGFSRTFKSRELFGSEIDSTASVYRDVAGARVAWDNAARFVRRQSRSVLEEGGVNVLEASELPGYSLAHNTLRFRIKVTYENLGSLLSLETVILSFRVANVVGAVTWATFNDSIPTSDVEEIALTQIDKIIQAIERPALPAETGA